MKHETPNQKVVRLLTTVPRLFAVKVDGIWRLAYGVYIKPLQDPLIAKVVYNGREIIFPDPRYCKDYEGVNEPDAEANIISRNISTLPKPPPGPKLIYSRNRPRMATYAFSEAISEATVAARLSFAEHFYPNAGPTQPEPTPTVHAEGQSLEQPPNTIIIDNPTTQPPYITTERAEEIIEHFLNTGDEAEFQSLEVEETPQENPLAGIDIS